MPDRQLLLVDGTAVAYRAFYAIRELSTSAGHPTNALFGFIRMVQQLREVWGPTHWAVVFDGGSPQERLSLLPSYKAQREPMPDALRSQLDPINEYLDLADVSRVRLPGQEADDVMATLARRASDAGARVMLATSDKDMYQIVSDDTVIIPPSKATEAMGPEEVRAKTGVLPERFVEWLALVGDTVDNIPGVPGVGPKTAAKLLNDCGSLAGVWERLGEIGSDRLRRVLQEHREVVERNLLLMRLRTDLGDVPDWESLAVRTAERARVVPFFERYEFRSMARAAAGPGAA